MNGIAQTPPEPPKWLNKCTSEQTMLSLAAVILKIGETLDFNVKDENIKTRSIDRYNKAKSNLQNCKNKNGGGRGLQDFFSYAPFGSDAKKASIISQAERIAALKRNTVSSFTPYSPFNKEAVTQATLIGLTFAGTLAAFYLSKGKPAGIYGLAARGITTALALSSSASLYSVLSSKLKSV